MTAGHENDNRHGDDNHYGDGHGTYGGGDGVRDGSTGSGRGLAGGPGAGGEAVMADGTDALMAAILDEPLSDEVRADPAFMTDHRSAAADVALLRAQLDVLADALTAGPAMRPAREPEPVERPAEEQAAELAPAPAVPLRPRPRRRLPRALRMAGMAAAGVLLAGSGWLTVQVSGGGAGIGASSDSGSAADQKEALASGTADPLGDPGRLACARLVVEGDVTGVDPVPGTDREWVTMRVTRHLRPAAGKGELTVVRDDATAPGVREGDHVLVAVPQDAAAPSLWVVGDEDVAAEREWFTAALSESSGPTCE